jgi:hypothetical protein
MPCGKSPLPCRLRHAARRRWIVEGARLIDRAPAVVRVVPRPVGRLHAAAGRRGPVPRSLDATLRADDLRLRRDDVAATPGSDLRELFHQRQSTAVVRAGFALSRQDRERENDEREEEGTDRTLLDGRSRWANDIVNPRAVLIESPLDRD